MNHHASNITIPRGQALVLVGAQGCGKTTLARQIAQAFGTHVEYEVIDLDHARGWNEMLRMRAQVCIVDGMPTRDETLERLKHCLTADSVLTRRPFDGQHEAVRPPRFIFCTHEVDAVGDGTDRRFHVVAMGQQQGAQAC